MKVYAVSVGPRLLGLLVAAGALATTAVPSRAIVTTPTTSATTLFNTIAGNITLVGVPTLISGPKSAGTFTGGLYSGIGIDAGIVLTSGDVTLITNSNTSTGITGDFGGGGDAQLSLLSGKDTYDATILTFDFKTSTGNLYFNFVFGSDEYNEYANSAYNDVFGFFVDGTNIALIPGTSTPISINTVNGGNPLGTDAQNPAYFHDNTMGEHPFEYDGFTSVFTVSALGLDPAATHTIKLAIADSSDHVLDSGVFIQAGSFGDVEPEPEGVPDAASSALLLGAGLAAVLGLRRRFAGRMLA